MRKECKILEDVPDPALRHSYIHALARIEQNAATDGNLSGVGQGKSGDAIENRGLPGTGRTKQDCDAPWKLKINGEIERCCTRAVLSDGRNERGLCDRRSFRRRRDRSAVFSKLLRQTHAPAVSSTERVSF